MTKPSTDWSYVGRAFKFLSRDEDGAVYFYVNKPVPQNRTWFGEGYSVSALNYPGFDPGTCHWTDSLVERP